MHEHISDVHILDGKYPAKNIVASTCGFVQKANSYSATKVFGSFRFHDYLFYVTVREHYGYRNQVEELVVTDPISGFSLGKIMDNFDTQGDNSYMKKQKKKISNHVKKDFAYTMQNRGIYSKKQLIDKLRKQYGILRKGIISRDKQDPYAKDLMQVSLKLANIT